MNLKNKSILVTGATGSFGKNFINHIINTHTDIKKLVVFSRDELKQHELKKELSSKKFSKN